MKLLGSRKSKLTKNRNGENVTHLEITEVVSVPFNIVNNDYQHNSRVLYLFIPNKSLDQLLDILCKDLILVRSFYILKFCLQITVPNRLI